MTLLKSIEKDFPLINKAAGEFLLKLSGTDLNKDIVLSAEVAGLMLLRASGVDVTEAEPGTVLLGAIPKETYEQVQRFMFGWALSNGLDPRGIGEVEIPADYKDYCPEITQLEQPFYDICNEHHINTEYYPFVASAATLRLVFAGDKLKLLDATTGLALALYHLISGSKTVPPKDAN